MCMFSIQKQVRAMSYTFYYVGAIFGPCWGHLEATWAAVCSKLSYRLHFLLIQKLLLTKSKRDQWPQAYSMTKSKSDVIIEPNASCAMTGADNRCTCFSEIFSFFLNSQTMSLSKTLHPSRHHQKKTKHMQVHTKEVIYKRGYTYIYIT